MNEELSVKFDLSAADNTLSEMWDEPAASKKEYLRTGLTYLILVGMMCYYKTPWQRQVIGLTAIAGFSFLFSKVMRWIVLRWGFRRDLLKTSEIIASVELIFSDKGVSYRSEKAVGSFDWNTLARVVNTPYGIVVELDRAEKNKFWIPLQVSPMGVRPRILEMLRSNAKVYLEPQAPQDPEYRIEFERYQMNSGNSKWQ